MTSSLTSLSGNRVIRGELNISSIYHPIDSDQVLNPYRLGLDLAVSEHLEEPDEYTIIHQIGTGFNDGLGNTGYQNGYCNDQVIDLYRLELDLLAYDNIRLSNPSSNYNPTLDQIGTEPTDRLCNTGFQNIYCSGQVLDSNRLKSDLPAFGQSGIDFSKPVTQLSESLGDLNQNIMSGFNVVAACSDNWRQSLCAHLSDHDDRLSKLEQTLSAMKLSLGKTQAASSELGMKQSRIISLVNQQENTVGNLNQKVLVSSKRARNIQSSMENRMEELGNIIEETRDVDMNAGVPPGVIQSLSNTLMGGALSVAIELLNQQVDNLTQISCTDQAFSADLRTEFSEFQES